MNDKFFKGANSAFRFALCGCALFAVCVISLFGTTVKAEEQDGGLETRKEYIRRQILENEEMYRQFSLKENWSHDEIVNVIAKLEEKKLISVTDLKAIDLTESKDGIMVISTQRGKGAKGAGFLLSYSKEGDEWKLFGISSFGNF